MPSRALPACLPSCLPACLVPCSDEVRATIEAAADLAPLHNPPNLMGIDAARQTFGDAPHVRRTAAAAATGLTGPASISGGAASAAWRGHTVKPA